MDEQNKTGVSKRAIWLLAALIAVAILAGSFKSSSRYDVAELCGRLYWPENSPARNNALYHASRVARAEQIPEKTLGSGDVFYGRAQLTAEAWKNTPGIEAASQWPAVSFRVSQAALLDKGNGPARVIRATAGNRMGLWIFDQSGQDPRSDIFIGHPGGNSDKPFQTTFIWYEGRIGVLNVLHRPDYRLENFLFRLGDDQAVCRVISDL